MGYITFGAGCPRIGYANPLFDPYDDDGDEWETANEEEEEENEDGDDGEE